MLKHTLTLPVEILLFLVLILWTTIEVIILRRHSTGELDGED